MTESARHVTSTKSKDAWWLTKPRKPRPRPSPSSPPSHSDVQELARIVREQDVAAFIETYLWIPTKSKGLQPWTLWPMQRHSLEHRSWFRDLVVKFRQGGSSKLELAVSFFKPITRPFYNVLIMGHEKTLPTEWLDDIRLFWRTMPAWARPEIRKGAEGGSEIIFKDLESSIRVGTAQTITEGAGAKLGRTVHRLHITEAADPRWKDDVLHMLVQTVPIDGGEIIVESTPKGARGWFYEEYEKARVGDSIFHTLFYPWYVHPEYRMRVPKDFEMTDEERALGLTPEQAAFRRFKIKEIGLRAFRELYPEDDISCFIFSGSPFFNPETLRHYLESPRLAKDFPCLRGDVFAEYPGQGAVLGDRERPADDLPAA